MCLRYFTTTGGWPVCFSNNWRPGSSLSIHHTSAGCKFSTFHASGRLPLSLRLSTLTLMFVMSFFWFQLGTRHILEAMKEAGHDIRTIFLCGGLSKNALFVQIHANATGISIIYTESYGHVLHIPVMSASTPRFTCGFTRSNGGGVDRSGNFGSLCFSGLRFCTGTTSAYTHTHNRGLCSWLMFSF